MNGYIFREREREICLIFQTKKLKGKIAIDEIIYGFNSSNE